MEVERVKCADCENIILLETSEKYGGLCKPCWNKLATKHKAEDLKIDEVEWELSPENAHPKAQEHLKDSFFWSICDDNSPLGNDTGADILHFYREWESENQFAKATNFLDQILKMWKIKNKDWTLLDENILKKELERDWFVVLDGDDTVIALAFAQIVIKGKVNKEIKRKALLAIKRQATDIVIGFRGRDNKQERKERLRIMYDALNEF